MSTHTDQRRYPIGRFHYDGPLSAAARSEKRRAIQAFPARLRAVVQRLSEEQLDRPYREGGWTARQVIHHVADSHLNAYIRFKLALTEEIPRIKGYDEQAWAELPDTFQTPVSVSLDLLEALHARWALLLEAMSSGDYERNLFHPEKDRNISLDEMLALYAWHGEHHLRHVELAGKKTKP